MEQNKSFKGKGVFANPRIDIAFKRCLGSPQYKDATIGLLNAFIPGRNIVDVKFENVEFPRESEDKKTIFIDIVCTDDKGAHFIVEMQRTGQPFFMQRMSYYASKVITTLDVDKGEIDYSVKPCYVIAFLDFDLAKATGMPELGDEPSLHFVTTYFNGEKYVQHPGSPEFYYFDLTKFKKSLGESADEKEIWLTLLNESQDMLDVPQSLMENKSYTAFFEGLRQVNFTKEETLEYFKQMTDEMCWRAALKYQKDEGRQEGKLDVARAMLADGLGIDKVEKYTGLSKESLEALLAEMSK